MINRPGSKKDVSQDVETAPPKKPMPHREVDMIELGVKKK